VLAEVSEKGAAYKSFEDAAQEKFGGSVDICLGNFEEKGKVNQDIAIFKYDYSYFMTPEEIKKKGAPTKLVPPKSFDFSKAERVIITKEELKKRELMEQEKLKDI
jgi:hypothetical protein